MKPHVDLRAHLGIFDGPGSVASPYLLSVGYGSATRHDPQDPMNREPHVDLRAHLGIFNGPDRLHPYLLSVGYGSATRHDPEDP